MIIPVVAAVLLCDAVSGANLDLLVLHNNDMHARFEQTSTSSITCWSGVPCVGGFARVAHVVREARRMAREGRGRPVLFLNAGDTYTGTAWFAVHKWKIAADFLNALELDAMSLGNHEFDFNPEGLAALLEQLNFPTVAANVDFSAEPSFQNISVPKSVVIEVQKRQIGIIGYLTPTTTEISFTNNVKITDEIEAIRVESEKLDAEGVKIIIAVGHSGFQMDRKIAAEVPLVDVVIGGHTNTFLWNGEPPDTEKPEGPYPYMVKQDSGKEVPVVQAYAYTKYLGQLNVSFDENGDLVEAYGQPLYLDKSVKQDEDILEKLDLYRAAVDDLNDDVVGVTKVFLDGDDRSCRVKECNFGNLITDALVAYRASVAGAEYWTDTPIGLFNGGAIRSSINSTTYGGNVTRAELLAALPFDNQIVSANILGDDLLTTLELGARSDGETSLGEFLQVSGIKVVYDYNQPSGSRVVSAKARCADCKVPEYSDININDTYRIITTYFLLSGGDGHYALRNGTFDLEAEGLNDMEIVEWYMGKKSPVYPEVFGRIRVIAAEEDTGDGDGDGGGGGDEDDNGSGNANVFHNLWWFTFLGFIVLNIVR